MNKIDINISGICEETFTLSILESLKIGASEIAKLRERILNLNEEKETLSNNVQEIKVLLDNANKANQACQSEMESLQKEKEDLKKQLFESDSKYESANSKLERIISDFEIKINSSEKENNTLQAALNVANENIENLKEEKEAICQEKKILNEKVEIYARRIDTLELAFVKILSECCLDIVKVLSTIIENMKNESLSDYIHKIIMGKEGSEVKGLSKFSELVSIDQVYRNVSLENTPVSNLATLLLWSTNDDLCEVIGGVKVWDGIRCSFKRFVSILEMAGITIKYPEQMEPDDSWLIGAKTDYNRTMHDMFNSIFGPSIVTKENCPIIVRRLSSKYEEVFKEGICYIS